MSPARLTTYPQRIWTVDIRTSSGNAGAVCRTCGPLDPGRPPSRALREHALRHLAAHARRDLTPAHLRSCQCGHRGCAWHRRHRGCSGLIVLAVTCEEASRSWRLADLCLQCANATAYTAAVPGVTRPVQHTPQAGARLGGDEEDEPAQVWVLDCPVCAAPAECCQCTDSPDPPKPAARAPARFTPTASLGADGVVQGVENRRKGPDKDCDRGDHRGGSMSGP